MKLMPTKKSTRTPDRPTAEAVDAARLAVAVGIDRQASDIVMIDVREVTAFADFMVIMTAGSPRQIDALAEELDKRMGQEGARRLYHREGTNESGWVLLDFADVVVHLFSEAQRDRYRLEQVWKDGHLLVKAE